jgi:hypothetical protein
VTRRSVGTLTVLNTYGDYGDNNRVASVEVDVTCDPPADIWQMPTLAGLLAAESAQWLGNTLLRRYQLYLPATAEVTTINE